MFDFPLPDDALCNIWLKLAQWLWWKRFLKNCSCIELCHFYLNLVKKSNYHLIRRKLHIPSPNDAWYQLIALGTIYPRCLAVGPADWNGQGLFLSLCAYHLKPATPLFAQWFWIERFLRVVHVFSLYHFYLPQKWISLTQGCDEPSLFKIGPVLLE